jgi:hypothetical protein
VLVAAVEAHGTSQLVLAVLEAAVMAAVTQALRTLAVAAVAGTTAEVQLAVQAALA